jgi:hypothetical protein
VLRTRIRTITQVPAALSGQAFSIMGDISTTWLYDLWTCVAKAHCWKKIPVSANPSVADRISNTSCVRRCLFETFDECETISRGPAAKVTKIGITFQLRNVGSILGRMASFHHLASHFENTCPSPNFLAIIVEILGVGFLKQNRNCLLCSLLLILR